MSCRACVTGIGGVFFKCRDPKALSDWYAKHLGVPYTPGQGAMFQWADDPKADGGATIWSAFPADTKYFGDGPSPFMINFRVADLEALCAQLTADGVQVEKSDNYDYGRFAWIYDPEGNKMELWQPLPEK